MNFLTTIQVRDIMRVNGATALYTNKTTKHPGRYRSVKCYYRGNDKVLAALRAACGEKNVNLTKGSGYSRSWGEGITVKCILVK